MRALKCPTALITLVTVTVALHGCAASGSSTASRAPVAYSLRRPLVYNSATCLVDPGVLTGRTKESVALVLAAAVVPKLVDLAFTKGHAALQKAAAAKVDTVAAKTGSYYYVYDRKAGADEGTVQVLGSCVAFLILDDSRSWTAFETALAAVKEIDKGTIGGLRKALGTEDDKPGPAFYYEAAMMASDDATAVQLRPALIYYPEPLADAKLGSERTLTAGYAFKDVAGEPFAATEVILPKIQVGQTIGPDKLRYLQSAWIPVATLSDGVKGTIAEEQSKPKPQLRVVKHLTPFNLEASISETREAREWLKAVADVLGSDEVKGAAATALKGAVLPKTEGEKEAEEISVQTLARDLALAKQDVKVACAEYKAEAAGSVERARKEHAVIEKQFDANEKAIKAGEKKPFPDPLKVDCP